MEDKTTYGQSLMHMIKGNLGTGILAMPVSIAQAGLINSTLGLPLLCLIATYCVHLLVDSSRYLESKTKDLNIEYSTLAKYSFRMGPNWMRPVSGFMCRLVDGTLLLAQIGVCCVYLVFVNDNITSILKTYNIKVARNTIFMAIFPVALSLSYIRTLRRLAIASTIANILEAIGIVLILQFLLRGLHKVDLIDRMKLKSLDSIALGFGSAMFAFEGISVVLPVYARMKNPLRMSNCGGIINVAYTILLMLYFVVGMSGFLRYGDKAGDSITLSLPPEPIYDAVRAMFMMAVFLTYPLQFYVPNEIIWNWIKRTMFNVDELIEPLPTPVVATTGVTIESNTALKVSGSAVEPDAMSTNNVWASESGSAIRSNMSVIQEHNQESDHLNQQQSIEKREEYNLILYEYVFRTALVLLTFFLAVGVPKLNLLMGLIGSITGTLLSFILPALIHLATFWDQMHGPSKLMIIVIDIFIILFGTIAGICGATSSMHSILGSFGF